MRVVFIVLAVGWLVLSAGPALGTSDHDVFDSYYAQYATDLASMPADTDWANVPGAFLTSDLVAEEWQALQSDAKDEPEKLQLAATAMNDLVVSLGFAPILTPEPSASPSPSVSASPLSSPIATPMPSNSPETPSKPVSVWVVPDLSKIGSDISAPAKKRIKETILPAVLLPTIFRVRR